MADFLATFEDFKNFLSGTNKNKNLAKHKKEMENVTLLVNALFPDCFDLPAFVLSACQSDEQEISLLFSSKS